VRVGEGGVSSPFYRDRGAPERVAEGVMAALMALTPLKMGVRLRGD
jgi:hypothetical protein